MTFIGFLIVIVSLLPQKTFAQLELKLSSEVSQWSFQIPFQVSLAHEGLFFLQRNSIFHLDHPQTQFFLHSYERGNVTGVTEISSLTYQTDYYGLELGRNYVSSGPSRLNATLFSAYTPALDQIAFHFFRFKGVDYEYRLIRLDNRQHTLGTFNRWLYYRRVSLLIGESIQLGLKDIVLATGIHRGIDLNYLNPGAIFQLEQLHGHVEAGTAGQNNDNQLMGFDIEWNISSDLRLYGDFILDEFQIDVADREHLQDVFGLTLGFEKQYSASGFIFEYFLASPWLYTNGGMYTNVEVQGIPLGLRFPQSQGMSVAYHRKLPNWSMDLQVSMYQTGDQTVSTEWNSFGNKIPLYAFDGRWETELDFRIQFLRSQYLDHLRLTYNLLDTKGFYLLAGFKLFNYELE